jgi:glyoxylase-like metal-dependent hydrolase (beta-lactamase superfamily II)
MLRERVSSDIYVFTSDLYVQVTAGVIETPDGAVVIDTLPFPSEAREIAWFVTGLSPAGVRYVVLTHYHADHTYGAYLFPDAQVVGHARCRQLLSTRGERGLAAARAEAPELEEVVLRLPDLTLDDGEMDLHVGDKTLRLLWTPGHSEDMLSVFVVEDRVLFASDLVMPVPTIVDGDLATMKRSLQRVLGLGAESIVQGHGEVILRGEVEEVIQNCIRYLDVIHDLVAEAVAQGRRRETLLGVDIERCGLSRVALNGQAPRLHTANLLALYDQMKRHAG